MNAASSAKVYVNVSVRFSEDGRMIPFSLVWEDGRQFAIDRVTEIKQAAAMRCGGQGDRYTIWVSGKQSYLYFERSSYLTGNTLGRWFVERKAG